MSTWSEVREALSDTLDLVPNLTVERWTPGQVNPPCVFPGSPSFEPSTHGGGVTASLTLHVAVPNTVEHWQAVLEDIVHGDDGILATLDANSDLGLTGASIVWTRVEGFGELEFAGATYLGATVDVEIEF